MGLLLMVVLICWWVSTSSSLPPHRDVQTRQGIVRGYLIGKGSEQHFAFLGLPYGRPPTQSDRFKAPRPPATWDGVFEATHRVKCPQQDGDGDENCLVVNVFAPKHVAADSKLPVVVYVHDVSSNTEWGAFEPPSFPLQDFVTVTFNYRIGVLGFLCLGIPEAPGNAGLKDQVAAIYWIYRNIADFGGNPQDITVYGSGSGAIFLQLLLLSGVTKGFVKRVILESGSVLSPSAMAYNPFTTALNVAITLGYKDEGITDDLAEFYVKKSLSDLINISTSFVPCVENDYQDSHPLVDQDPIQMLKQGDIDKVPMIITYSNAPEILEMERNSQKFSEVPKYFEEMLPPNLEFQSENVRNKVATLVKDFYFHAHDFDENVLDSFKDYINDVVTEYPTAKFCMLYASRSLAPVYLMKFKHEKGDTSTNRDIAAFIFAKHLKDEEKSVGEKLVKLWTNFIKLGDPTPLTTSLIPVIWQPINNWKIENVTDIKKVPYLMFHKVLKMTVDSKNPSLLFWDQIYEKFYKMHMFDRI